MGEQAVPVWRLPDGELAVALLGWEQEARQRYMYMLEMVAEAERRGLAAALGYRDSVALLAETLRVSPREARARVTHAAATLDTAAASGAEMPAPMPATGAALADGDIGPEHVTEIGKVISEVSGLVDDDGYGRAEHDLVELARQAGPAAVRKLGRHLLAYLDQDGKAPDDEKQAEPYREFAWHYTRSGWMRFCGHLDPESAAQLEGLIGALAKPEPTDACEPLDIGRAARLATGAQRRALVLRDGGCAFPGCDRGPKWTTAHHIHHWVDGGLTDLHNLVLLCARHHRRIHHSEWEVAIRGGKPEFYPPGWIDPNRTPLHNRAHDPPGYSVAA